MATGVTLFQLEEQGEKFHPSFITLQNRVKEIRSSSNPQEHELRPLVMC